jgi:hypothetical protein
MSKCITCGASWTTAGLALCPICGAKVGAAGDGAADRLKPELSGARIAAAASSPSGRLHRGTTVRMPMEPSGAPRPVPPVPPAPKSEEKSPLVKAPEPRAPEVPEDKSPKATEDKSPAPKSAEPRPEPADRAREPRPESPMRVSTRLIDSSVKVLPAEMTTVPVPERPMNGPVILGALAWVTGLLLPLTLIFEGNRVFGVLGFCMSGFFVPFAPIAWIAGLMAERRRNEQGLQAEPRVVLGRLLGQWATLLLIAEVTLALILIAGLRLAGKLPSTFWVKNW